MSNKIYGRLLIWTEHLCWILTDQNEMEPFIVILSPGTMLKPSCFSDILGRRGGKRKRERTTNSRNSLAFPGLISNSNLFYKESAMAWI
jgi:hypothetical protein